MTKLERLAEIEGFQSPDDMIDEKGYDCVVPAICMNEECEYTTGMEPDQSKGYCEVCGTQTVKSCLVLAGLI